jgi:hypothetical protein
MRDVDPDVAADQFAGMVLTPLRLRMLFKVIEEPDPETLGRQLVQAVETVLTGVACYSERRAYSDLGQYSSSCSFASAICRLCRGHGTFSRRSTTEHSRWRGGTVQ